MAHRTLDGLAVAGKRVLVRADLNVPVRDGRITDLTRIERLSPTIRELADAGARVIVFSHFDRPKGKRVPHMSLAPMAAALAEVLGRPVAFAEDSTGPVAHAAADRLADGDVLLLENTRFHPGEEANDPALAAEFAALAEIYVHDAFSAAHRAHASTEGVGRLLPAYAGRLMQAELEALDAALGNPVRPVAAVVGGSKVSTKLELLGNLVGKVDVLVIGGAMASTARDIMARAAAGGCEIVLPRDAVVAEEFRPNPPTRVVPVTDIPAGSMMLDVGPGTVADLVARLPGWRTLVWNGPLGAFETPPFDAATAALAQAVAAATDAGGLRSVAGGGDTVSALRQAGVMERMSYVSAAGGAFLEWLEGKALPGVAILMHPA
jgi:phosphoglycerate kinase